MIDWPPFLARWSKELMNTDLAGRVDPPPNSCDWLGYPPASEIEIEKLEGRLGVRLPPTYRSFLLTTNGWRRTTPFIDRIRPAQDVEWFRVENEEWVEIYSEDSRHVDEDDYYEYGNDCAADHCAEHMAGLVQISDVDDGVYLLNPEAVTPDGEWEAWFFANWIPGARRYPSFAHLMLREYQSFVNLESVKGVNRSLPKLTTFPPDVPRVPMERNPSKQRAKSGELEDLIDQLRLTDVKTHALWRFLIGAMTTRIRKYASEHGFGWDAFGFR